MRYTRAVKVMMPNPPTWMRPTITAWPYRVKAVPVSTTTSPVTQTAEVEVKSASTKPTLPLVCDHGRRSSMVPARMAPAKLPIKIV